MYGRTAVAQYVCFTPYRRPDLARKIGGFFQVVVPGLARVVRGFIIPTYENALQWHERDLANSSSERFIIPHACILVDDILIKLSTLVESLQVFPENMRKNIDRVGGEIMAESVMQTLTKTGLARDQAYRIVRNASVDSRQSGIDFKDVLLKNKKVKELLTEKELEKALNPNNYSGSSEEIVERVKRIINRSKLIK